MGNDDKSYDNPLPHERTYMFNRFLAFRNLGPGRTYADALEIMKCNNESQKYGKDKNLTPTALRKNAKDWQWKARAELWDANNLLQQQLENEETFKSVNQKLINQWKGIVGFVDNILNQIYDSPKKQDGTPYALPTVIGMLRDAVDILKICNEQIRICCGYHPQNEIKVTHTGGIDVDVSNNISEEIILKPEYAELTRKLLEDVTNGQDS